MNTFSLRLQDATHTETIPGVSAFVGADASGSFALWAGHERLVTELEFGLARFRAATGDWQYLAVPGALLYFSDDTLTLCARRFVLGDDYERISAMLREQLQAEERDLHRVKMSLRKMEDAVMKRLYEINARQTV